MSWIRQNSFLAGFLSVTGLGAIALGVLVYLQYDKYATVSEEFQAQSKEWTDLQRNAPFPNEENLKKLRALKQNLDGEITNMLTDLVKMSLEVEEVTPEQFQDKLRSSVLGLQELAKQNNVKLPEKFYLGFDGYQSLPPKKEAAVPLARQLAGMELAVKLLIENRVSQIDSIKRVLLAEEDGKSAPQAAAGQPKNAHHANGPVHKMSFALGFKAEHYQARKALNAIVHSESQFFILRSLQVKNEKLKAPSKKDSEEKPAANRTDLPASESSESTPATMKFVVGTEKVDVDAQIEIANFKINPGK